MKRKKFGNILIKEGLITKEQLKEALIKQKKTKKHLGNILLEAGFVSKNDIYQTLSKQMGIPLISINKIKIKPNILNLVSADLCYKKKFIPIMLDKRGLVIAIMDPTDYQIIKDVSFATGHQVRAVLATKEEILSKLESLYRNSDNDFLLSQKIAVDDDKDDVEEGVDEDELKDSAEIPEVIRVVNSIIATAIKKDASDIHIEPQEKNVIVRCRIDGVMRNIAKFKNSIQDGVISRIKIMSNLDITIRKEPQDGRARVSISKQPYDLRVSTLPIYYGEKIVIRILDSSQAKMTLSQLGFAEKQLDTFQKMAAKPQGMLLITGPTGSGKTTTLYATLNFLNSPETNIITVEDPVEYQLAGINQVQINPKTGLTFASALRSILRQDPDIVMVGEIRDHETASIAFKAAQTGHLVLGTLHTNDAASTITRLIDMRIDPYLVASSLLGVLAQRLLRRICNHCSTEITPSTDLIDKLPISEKDIFKKGVGCEKCNSDGYKGRVGVYELLVITRNISSVIISNSDTDTIADEARKEGMISMSEDGLEKARQGITTLEEVMRVVPPRESTSFTAAPQETLPLKIKPQQPEKPIARQKSKIFNGHLQEKMLQAETILVVDDDAAIREYIKAIFESEYFNVDIAVDGEDGIRKVYENPPNLIVTDYLMPNMNGIDFIRKLKADSRTSLIPALMLTSTNPDETEISVIEAGADDWIQKPVNVARLIARSKRLLKLRC
ncbi:type IV pilus assembly protein PilB [Candidatus Magnetomoraceae bacterium gMMP-13]